MPEQFDDAKYVTFRLAFEFLDQANASEGTEHILHLGQSMGALVLYSWLFGGSFDDLQNEFMSYAKGLKVGAN